jgi:hypothetical protein
MTRAELAVEVKRLRDSGFNFFVIAERLGISRSYASELYRDPEGLKARARKDGYRKPCPDCGNLMDGSSGPNHPPGHCADCAPKHHAIWTRETVIAAFQDFHRRFGRTPVSADTQGAPSSVTSKLSPERVADIHVDHGLPTPATVKALFGSWPAAQQAAGLATSLIGTPAHRAPNRDAVRRDNQILDAIRHGADTSRQIALVCRRDQSSLNARLAQLAERGLITRTPSRRPGAPYVYELAETPRS